MVFFRYWIYNSVDYFYFYWVINGGLMDNEKGLVKFIIKIYFYLIRGVDVINTFRNPVILIFGFCFTFKEKYPLLEDLRFISIISIVSILLMIILGFLMVHIVGRYIDYLNVKHSTYWSKYGYELQENILKELKELNKGKNGNTDNCSV